MKSYVSIFYNYHDKQQDISIFKKNEDYKGTKLSVENLLSFIYLVVGVFKNEKSCWEIESLTLYQLIPNYSIIKMTFFQRELCCWYQVQPYWKHKIMGVHGVVECRGSAPLFTGKSSFLRAIFIRLSCWTPPSFQNSVDVPEKIYIQMLSAT